MCRSDSLEKIRKTNAYRSAKVNKGFLFLFYVALMGLDSKDFVCWNV